MTTAPYDPLSGNTPDAKPVPYDPRSGNTPDYQYPTEATDVAPGRAKFLYNYTDPDTGDIIDVYENNGERVETIVKKGTKKKDATDAADALAAERLAGRVSAYDLMYKEFKANKIESLIQDAKDAILKEDSDSARLIALRNSPSYAKRFGANAKRIANGFKAIDEGTYLALEDAYQTIAQNYGLPEKYYKRGDLGVQPYFEEAISKNIDPQTFNERIIEGQKVLNTNKATFDAAKKFYPTLTDGDFLDYVINPKNAIEDIKRKVATAEIGGAALQANLKADLARAEELQRMGVDKEAATAGYSAIGAGLQRGSELSAIYGKSPYDQTTAEEELFKLKGAAEARKKRQEITGLETAAFGAKTGLTGSALARDRAGAY